MIIEMFAVRDTVAESFLQPMFFPNLGSALRAFRDAASDPSHMFSKNRRDFALYRIGSFDDVAGRLTALMDPEFVLSAHEVLPHQKEA